MVVTASDLTPVADHLGHLTAEDEFSGAVAVVRGDEPLLRAAFGYASRTWGVAATLETRLDTASITKVFTAVAILQLVERGAFVQRTEDQLPLFVNKPANFAPGDGCRYCNGGYVLLGLMIERAAGVPYRSYVTDHVLGPAGMARSGFFRMDAVEPDVAEGVEPRRAEDGRIIGWQRNIYSYPPIGGPDGGAHATVDDLVSFRRALAGGRLLGAEATAAALEPLVRYKAEGEIVRMNGLVFEFDVGPDGGVRSHAKDGINVGVSGILRHYPGEDVTVAVLAVGERAAWEPIALLDRVLAP